MVVVFGMIDIDIDLVDTILSRILMVATSPILFIGYILLSPILIIGYNLVTNIGLLPSAIGLTLFLAVYYCSAHSKTCKNHYQSRVVKKKRRRLRNRGKKGQVGKNHGW